MMIDLLSILKTKNSVTAILLLAYLSTCLAAVNFNKNNIFNLSGGHEVVNTSESTDLPLSDPIPAEPKSSDAEDKFSPDDENFIEFSSPSTSTLMGFRRFHHGSSPPLPGAINSPFSPPEIRHA